ncbi:hypothetical protein KA005_28650 [bacterium]|nr:hypothetical protein [bacterium]
MKLEARTKEFYRSAFQSSPKLECLLQNQVYMFECILEILSRLDWRGPIKEPEFKDVEIKIDRSGSAYTDKPLASTELKGIRGTGETDFKKQAKEITERARQNIEEEPL